MNNGYRCPVCGTKDKTVDPGHFFNVTAIQNETTWVRIELTDAEISQLARGTHRIVVTPKEDIAAEPDLLAALIALTDWAREHTGPLDTSSPHALLVAARAAIAKAEAR
jgi:hypothetical protein